MNIFDINKVMQRLDNMIDNAIDGNEIENEFDETKMSALETKLNRYLLMSKTKHEQIEEEKAKIKELISDISHQTKTPIANLMLYSGLLSEESNLSENSKKFVHEITKQSEKLSFLINSLVKTSRLETGIITVNPKQNSIDELLNDTTNEILSKSNTKNISVTNLSSDTGFSCKFDYKWTSEALLNILDNAVKYTDKDGKINISVTAYELFYRIDIDDNGIGIAKDEQNKIFRRFYRSSAVSDKEGVGIGLYLAREIVERQGGYIIVASELGKGTKFSVFLPR